MADIQKYNTKEMLLQKDEELMNSSSIIGKSGLTLEQYNNSMRVVMFNSHLNQFVCVSDAEFPFLFTNMENLVGEFSDGYYAMKSNSTVFRKVVKFEEILDNPNTYALFVFNHDEDKYDVIVREDVEDLTEVYGYEYNNEVIDSIDEGDLIKKDEVIFKSSSYDDAMNYGFGKNVTVMYTNDPFTSEDAAVVSKELSENTTSVEVERVIIDINDNDYLLNIYGDRHEYKTIPDIGERSNGILAASRRLYNNQVLYDFKDTSLSTILDSDSIYYHDGEVVDITVFCNNPDVEETSFNRQILKYLRAQNTYYQEIKDTCEEIFASGKDYTPLVDRLYNRARDFLDNEKKWRDGDSTFSYLKVFVTVKKKVGLYKGQKITGRYGNKSVISDIRDNDDMPFYYDKDGNKKRVDLLLNLLAIINRTTAGPIFELTLNFMTKGLRLEMSHCKTLKEQERLLFGFLHKFNTDQEISMKKTYLSLSTKDKKEYMRSCIEEGIYLHQPPMWEKSPLFYRIMDLYESYEWLTPYDTYINKFGRTIKVMNQQYIGEMYIMKLKQTSRKGFSVRGIGAINSKGLPERSYKSKAHMELASSTAIRFGEYETYNFCIGMDPEELAFFHALYRTSVHGRKDLGKSLLNPKEDEVLVDKSYTSRVAEIFGVIMKSLGFKTDFVDEENVLYPFNDDVINSFEINGTVYFGTPYQEYTLKKYFRVREIFLSEYGVLTEDQLNKLVDEEMRSEHYVTGTQDYKEVIKDLL